MDCSRARVDLHIHSTASDGTHSPSVILEMAQSLGLSAISLTDHDTLQGVILARSAGIPDSLAFLNGVEISAAYPERYPGAGSFHILGYGVRTDDPELNRELARLRDSRKNRNPAIIKKLNDLGFAITLDAVSALSGKVQIGRPHIARALVEKGYVDSVDQAFDCYLGTDKPAYVDRYRLRCETAIAAIQKAGGLAVMAHPALIQPLTDQPLAELLALLKQMGLAGIEAYYPIHSPEQTQAYLDLARQYDLVPTGGTDFHGGPKPDIQIGVGKGDFCVPHAVYANLIKQL